MNSSGPTEGGSLEPELLKLLAMRKGHFRLESGHHGDLWLDLELLCLRPAEVRRFAVELARRIAKYEVEVVCGPLVEGAFVALMVAAELGVEFCYSERFKPLPVGTLFPVDYRIPLLLRDRLRGRRVAIVNDVINAGSAVRGTLNDLQACGAKTTVIGSLVVLGSAGSRFAEANCLPLEALAALPNTVWSPADCPLCGAGAPLGESTLPPESAGLI